LIALDTSSLIAYLEGAEGADVNAVEEALILSIAVLPPVVLTELLSSPTADEDTKALIRQLPLLQVTPGYWERAATLGAGILAKGLRANLADTLISQSCLDNDLPLVTRDRDFRHFAAHGGLMLKAT
jgi:predicted nucleic acid-binding protein